MFLKKPCFLFLLEIYDDGENKTARNDEAMHMGVCAERERDEKCRKGWRL